MTRSEDVVRVLTWGEGRLQGGVHFQQACCQLVCCALAIPAGVQANDLHTTPNGFQSVISAEHHTLSGDKTSRHRQSKSLQFPAAVDAIVTAGDGRDDRNDRLLLLHEYLLLCMRTLFDFLHAVKE